MPSPARSINRPWGWPASLPAILLAAILTPVAIPAGTAAEPAATDPVAAEIGRLVAARQTKPSIHDDQPAIERALAAAGLPDEAIARLFLAIGQDDLPGMGASLDSFLFLTRDPEWQPLRRHFAEYLELPGVTDLDAGRVRPLIGYGGVVTLPAIATLTPETAAALAAFGQDDWGAALEFPAVESLTPAAAAALARCNALLVFPHLHSLSVEAARALAGHEGIGIVLGGLTALPADVADALAGTQSIQGLMLPDLERLDSVPLAKRLARQDHVFLPRITALDPEIAAALRDNEGGELALPGLRELSPDVARQFVGAGYYWLRLGGADRLASQAAAVLAGHNGQLTFTGAVPPSPEAAAKLAAHQNNMSLPQVTEFPADVIRSLQPHAGGLILGGLTDLPPESAALLAEHVGGLYLPALKRITPEAAALLAARIDSVGLPGLESLDAATAAAFVAHAKDTLAIGGLTEITPEVATALAAFPGRLALPQLTTLTPDVARQLAAHRGTLALESLEDLSADSAAALARHEGQLDLHGVERLSTAAAEALAEAPGLLSLPSLHSLTPAGAAALCRRTGPLLLDALQYVDRLDSVSHAQLLVAHCDDLELANLTALEGPEAMGIAKVLATARGTLAFPMLERITPRALELLLAKPGVELPAVEELELVPEPGGGVNDDVILPER